MAGYALPLDPNQNPYAPISRFTRTVGDPALDPSQTPYDPSDPASQTAYANAAFGPPTQSAAPQQSAPIDYYAQYRGTPSQYNQNYDPAAGYPSFSPAPAQAPPVPAQGVPSDQRGYSGWFGGPANTGLQQPSPPQLNQQIGRTGAGDVQIGRSGGGGDARPPQQAGGSMGSVSSNNFMSGGDASRQPAQPAPSTPAPQTGGDAKRPSSDSSKGGIVALADGGLADPSGIQQAPPQFDYSQYLAQNALDPNAAPGPQGGPSVYTGWTGNLSDTNPADILQQNRQLSLNTGANLGQNLADSTATNTALTAYYRNAANTAYSGLAQQPGYSPTEAADITRQSQLYSGLTTPDQYASLAPTAAETAGIQGNPQSIGQYYDPSQLTQGSAYQQALQGTLGGIGGDVSALQGDTSQFAQKYQMTPAEQQDIVASTSADLASQRAGEEGDIQRAANAAGVSQLGVAAAENRVNVQGTAAAGDALTNARIAASNAAAARLQGIQTAEQNTANTGVGAGAITAGAQTAAEGQRIGAEQYSQQLGTGIATTEDAAAAARASQLYGIRQGNTQYAQQSTYGQNLATQQQLANANTNVAGARIAGQNNYLNFLTGQTGQTLGAQQTSQGLQQQNASTMLGNANTAGGQKANLSLGLDSNSLGTSVDKGVGSFIGNLRKGGIVKRVRKALIGEAGPEAVIPLRGDDMGEQQQLDRYRGMAA